MEKNKEIYDDFYVAYFDSSGMMIYPSNVEEVRLIKQMLGNITSDNFIFIEERNLCYKVRVKRQVIDGNYVQVVELSNVTEFIEQIAKASIDEITHLSNRKLAWGLINQYIEVANNTNENFAIIVADLDEFKSINDTYGHVNGDVVLSEVSRVLYCSTRHSNFRQQDIVARIGGDEFIIVLKNISSDVSIRKANKMRDDVFKLKVPLFDKKSEDSCIDGITLSMGLYYVNNDVLNDLYTRGYTTNEILKVLIDRTDTALYESKNAGKNRVTTFTDEAKVLKLKGKY